MPKISLSLVIPCYNEIEHLKKSVESCLRLRSDDLKLEIIIVDDCSRDGSDALAQSLADEHPEIVFLRHDKNRGKGAALKTGFLHATGEFVGIQDADTEYSPLDYLKLVKPLISNKADVVYGSRYLRQTSRRVLYFWHTWMNKKLTTISNMFTNLDLTDMETCYKLFRREALLKIIPELREERFGFEPEVTCLVNRFGFKIYETAIHYQPRSYAEGKKITWRDGFHALYCILHYGAPYAPLPMQVILYFMIGAVCALLDIVAFTIFLGFHFDVTFSIALGYILATTANYFLSSTLLFKDKGRWTAPIQLLIYMLLSTLFFILDLTLTSILINLGINPVLSKAISAISFFFANFCFRKHLVF